MRLERPRFQFGMVLHPDEPRMVLVFDDLRQDTIGRHAREAQAVLLKPVLVSRVDLVAMTVPFGNLQRAAIDSGNAAAARERRRVSAEPHGPAKVAGPGA